MLLGFNYRSVPAIPIHRICRGDIALKVEYSPPLSTPVTSKNREGWEHVERPKAISIEEDKGHSPLTERWNWTFFSGKTRRRDGTRRDTVRKKEESRTWDVVGPGTVFVILLER